MSDRILTQTQMSAIPTFTPMNSGVLQRQCACGNHTVAGGACESCRTQGAPTHLQRTATNAAPVNAVPASVHDVLRSPGQPLDGSTRAFMEPRFGHDFSQVRVHSDAKAAASAQSVHAVAYTLSPHVVFGEGKYAPGTSEGKLLLTHELTHVMQQGVATMPGENSVRLGMVDTPQEREAESVSQHVVSTAPPFAPIASSRSSGSTALIQRQPELPSPSPVLGQFHLTIDNQGRVDVRTVGPATTPVVSSPTIGIRRDPNGQIHLLVGGKDKVITIDDIPKLLRQATGVQPGGTTAQKKFRVPTCNQLRLFGGKEKVLFMTFEQYKLRQQMFHSQVGAGSGDVWLELTPPFFDALLESCMSQLIELPRQPAGEKPPLQDAPERILPEGQEYA